MNPLTLRSAPTFVLSAVTSLTLAWSPQSSLAAGPYKIVNLVQVAGTGPIDYVYADNDGGRLYVPRGEAVLVFDLDTLKPAGTIPSARARGVAVDPKSHHGFCSSSPVVMWDTEKLTTLKTIKVAGRPDSILFEPLTQRVYVFSHSQPNATIIDGKSGSVVSTLDLGGEPEQGVSDGQGHVFVALEDKSSVAVVDAKDLKVTGHYELGSGGGGPVGVALDKTHRVLFVFCRTPANAIILNADTGKILTTLPIGKGTDSGAFNPATMEAFSSQGDGTLTVIKETSPTEFAVAQTVKTKSRAKTCTLDTKKNQLVLITTESMPAPPAGGGGGGAPSMLDIIVVGR